MQIKKKILPYLVNFRGWRTKRKLVVFESDDWGSTRMASRQAYDHFLQKGYAVDRCPYNRFDSLESNQDVEGLLSVLEKFKDKYGNAAVFTLNAILANPNFEKIKEHQFLNYFYEPFDATLTKYPAHDKVISLINQGISSGAFNMQFHGREHLNTNRWMEALQKKNKRLLSAFDWEMFSVHEKGSIAGKYHNLDAFGYGYANEISDNASILKEGLTLFKRHWGTNPRSFIAPCYTWDAKLESVLKEIGIEYLQGTHVQKQAMEHASEVREVAKRHFLGQTNAIGQKYLVRNAYFEPASNPKMDWVNRCMKEVSIAFQMRKPAVICSHRLNYIGSIFQENREQNLSLLSTLLQKLTATYKEIEFVSTDQLITIMEGND